MKYIKLFQTEADREAAVLERPYVVYTKEMDRLEIEDEYPITSAKNPALMSLCYSQGWSENETYMTKVECASVSDAQLAATVVSSASSFTSVRSFKELIYFTGITSIPVNCFKNCTLLNNIVLPDNIISIGNSAFEGCTGFNNREIKMPSNLKSIGTKAFYNVSLSKIVFPESCTSYGERSTYNVLRLDMSATKISSPSGEQYSDPLWVKLPSACTTIGQANSIGRTKTKSWLWIDATTPPAATGYYSSIYPKVRVYVPDGYEDVYKSSSALIAIGGATWASIASQIYPQSQWETDKENGLIDI